MSAVLIIIESTSAPVSDGIIERINKASPATIGAAIDVPDKEAVEGEYWKE